jgi:hypothetical protein
MRTLLVLICSLALAFAASGAQDKKKEQKPAPKKQTQTAKGAKQRGGGAKPDGPKVGGPHQLSGEVFYKPPGAAKGSGTGKPAKAGAAGGQAAAKTKQGKANVAQAKSKPLKPQHFNVAKQPNTAKAPPVKFQQGRRIQGSQNWQGQRYAAFRNYKSEWHDRNWWHHHHNRIVFVFGAPYFWNAGYWYPAWGYNPNAYYAWDGPIYAYNNLPPDQVIANVQSALQQQGYYQGDVDGLVGPLTRSAIADYQRDHGLYVTSAIDQPTLQSLGMS